MEDIPFRVKTVMSRLPEDLSVMQILQGYPDVQQEMYRQADGLKQVSSGGTAGGFAEGLALPILQM